MCGERSVSSFVVMGFGPLPRVSMNLLLYLLIIRSATYCSSTKSCSPPGAEARQTSQRILGGARNLGRDAIMDTRFRSSLDKHPICFFAVCVLVQLDLMENPLFKSDYDVVYTYLPKPPHNFQPPEAEDDSISNESSDNEGSEEDTLDLGTLFRQMQVRSNNSSDSDDEEANSTTS
jgi:hypothetical protein